MKAPSIPDASPTASRLFTRIIMVGDADITSIFSDEDELTTRVELSENACLINH